jgi:RNA polymerase sigma-70 factor (ECF subfamily)
VLTRDLAFTGVERAASQADEAEVTFHLDEDAFRAFYERTARPLWAYLSRITGSAQAADDLLQETYYRFLRAQSGFESEAHRRNYLFRIATNLACDERRNRRHEEAAMPPGGDVREPRAAGDVALMAAQRTDLGRAMALLRPRERAIVWLAYAEGSSHQEIADRLGLGRAGIKVLLFRARRKLAALLGAAGDAGRDGREER